MLQLQNLSSSMKKSTKMIIDSKTYLGLTSKDHNRSTDQLKKKVLALRNNFINYIVNLSICFKIYLKQWWTLEQGVGLQRQGYIIGLCSWAKPFWLSHGFLLLVTTNKQGNLRGLLCWRRRPDQTNKEVLSSYPDCGFLGKDFQFPQWPSQTHINKLCGHLKNLLVGRP